MRKLKGFALVQAMVFMMFIAAAISISMVVKVNESTRTAPADTAVEAFPAVQGFIDYALAQTDPSSASSQDYTDEYLSKEYTDSLNPSVLNTNNMSVTVEQ